MNLSIGLWQLSRIYTIIDSPQEAMRYAVDCLDVSVSNNTSPFCIAYAHEAVSRAAIAGGDIELSKSHLVLAKQHAGKVTDTEDKKLIDADVEELTTQLS